MAAVFISPILVSPFRSSAQPATHAKRFPIKALPLEMTQVNHFPTNTNPDAIRVHIWPDKPHPQREFLHFLDDNFHRKLEPAGIWTRGDKTCEFILKTYYPLREVGVRLLNNPRSNNELTGRGGRRTRESVRPQVTAYHSPGPHDYLKDGLVEHAKTRVKEILKNHKPPLLDKETAERVSKVAKKYGIVGKGGKDIFPHA